MKIMLCIGTLTSGGAERVICNLANNLVKNNQIELVSISRTEIAYELNSNVKVEFIDDFLFDKKKSEDENAIRKVNKNITRLRKLNIVINNFKPDIIVSFLPEPNFLVLFLKKFNKIPTIISVRVDPKMEYKTKLYRFIMKRLYPKTDGIVFQTEEAKEYFKDILNCSQKIIPNPINEEFIIDEFKGKRKKVIVSVGRLGKQKNHKFLINAFSKISEEFKEYKLIIYGDGILRDELNELIKKLNLEDRVFLPGISKDIKNEIYDASLFVLTSDYEGMPNALMEAMTLGLPVISTDCPSGGPKFLIKNNENGLLINVNDENALVESMKKILLDDEFSSKLQKNARNIAIDLAPQKIYSMWNDYITEIYNKCSGEK